MECNICFEAINKDEGYFNMICCNGFNICIKCNDSYKKKECPHCRNSEYITNFVNNKKSKCYKCNDTSSCVITIHTNFLSSKCIEMLGVCKDMDVICFKCYGGYIESIEDKIKSKLKDNIKCGRESSIDDLACILFFNKLCDSLGVIVNKLEKDKSL